MDHSSDSDTTRLPSEPHLPRPLTPHEKNLVLRHLRVRSQRHGEFFIESHLPDGTSSENEVWYLGFVALHGDRDEAVDQLTHQYALSESEALAAYLFCRAFPETVKELGRRHAPDAWPETRRVAQPSPYEELGIPYPERA